ncbi:DUF3520 domain-containing protein [Halovulum dunhuangense]|uniref:DUF3520 domain-containing protein n=1 Tax=Halovulum dunhuangense TaxID=1505036 RepID=A0A849KY06_9RHOB|nr:von Willebrand factor type A domain-containing protein [Halovulum dunhuangense]NNU78826.1 DUF3520 domain-containing protein [Halovulum dunhuangense]
MTEDPLDRLRGAMKDGTPPASDAARDRALRIAAENFARHTQGSQAQVRPTPDRPTKAAGFWKGVRAMLNTLTPTRALVGTTALASIAVAAVLVRDIDPTRPAFAPSEFDASDSLLAEPAISPPAPQVVPPQARMSNAAPPVAAVSPIAESDMAGMPMPEGEQFPELTGAGLKITAEHPVSTFSIDVDTASYALLRSSLQGGYKLPADAIRIEEMLNYFDYAYPQPEGADALRPSVSVAPTPWNPDTRLLHVAITSAIPDGTRPPLDLVFLIDTSGSMDMPDKLPLLLRSFGLLLDRLDENDSVSIVTYAGSAGMALDPTPASERQTILAALGQLSAGGGTAGGAGLETAYAVAERMQRDGSETRVILATDGDFNLGLSDPARLEEYIAEKREGGVSLSVLGFGRGNINDAIMQSLAQNGNGFAAYIDTLSEARRVLVEDMTASLVTAASDVKVQIEFNPAQVSEYRLIGYETRALDRTDFADDRVDAGEVGAGHQVTAIYEITPRGSAAERARPLRYGEAAPVGTPSDELAYLSLRYKQPGETESKLIDMPILPDAADIPTRETEFAAAVAGFGLLLRGEDLPGWDWPEAEALARGAIGADPFGYRAELVRLIGLAGMIE